MSDNPTSGSKPPERASKGRRDLDESSGAGTGSSRAGAGAAAGATADAGAGAGSGAAEAAGFPFADDQTPQKRSKAVPAAAVALVALLGVGLGGYVLGGGSGGDQAGSATTSVASSDETGVESETTTTTAGGTTTTLDDTTTTVEATTTTVDVATTTVEATTTTEPDATTSPSGRPIAGPDDPVVPRYGSYFGGKITLVGSVPSDEVADAIVERAAAVIGADNVVDTYVVDVRAAESSDGQIRVDEPILFPTGSAVIGENLKPILDLGVVVLQLNPQAEMIVEGHTDDRGDDASNLDLSIRRAQAVADYIVAGGVDPARVEAVGLGETAPVAPNETAEGRALNRRIEVEILNLLG